MKKIPTLFERIFEKHKKVGILPNVTSDMEWVLAGEGVATEKIDGTYEVVGPHFRNNPYGLEKNYTEGIVFWKDGEPKCKIKRSDFGFRWN